MSDNNRSVYDLGAASARPLQSAAPQKAARPAAKPRVSWKLMLMLPAALALGGLFNMITQGTTNASDNGSTSHSTYYKGADFHAKHPANNR